MSPEAIARNYAEVLFALGDRSGRSAEYLELLDAVAVAIELSPETQAVLASPRVTKQAKMKLLADALPNAHREFVLFLHAVLRRHRQRLLPLIAKEYIKLLDLKLDRVRAFVTVAHAPNEELARAIAARLSEVTGKEVIPVYRVEPHILGGAIVRVGDRVHNFSIRRKIAALRKQLLAG